MKRIIVLTFLLLLSSASFGQYNKVELTPEEIQFLAQPKMSILSNINADNFITMLDLNETPFLFEISKSNVVLYRGTINKWYEMEANINNELSRTRVGLCLKLNDIGADNALKIVESYKWSIKEKFDQKYICNSSFEIFNDKDRNNITINNILDGEIETKVYKLVLE